MVDEWLVTIRNINYKRHVIIALLFGILLTAVFSPIVSPWVQDRMVGTPLIPTPEPNIDYQYRNTSATGYISDQTQVDLTEPRYRTFYVDISNPTQKLISDLNLNLFFSGCPLVVEIQYTNLDDAIASRHSDDIETRHLANFLNRGCGASIDIEELPPGRWARIFVIIDTERVDQHIPEDERLDSFQLGVYKNYQWELNGRVYHERPDPQRIVVDDRLAGEEIVAPVFQGLTQDDNPLWELLVVIAITLAVLSVLWKRL